MWNPWRAANPKAVVDLLRANLSGAVLHSVNLQDAVLLEALLDRADFAGATFIGADLRAARLRDANLTRANIAGATLIGADMGGATMVGADLTKCELRSADLRSSDLRDASLKDADLFDANFSNANLAGADFTGAYLGGTILSNVNLAAAHGIDKCRHSGPSILDHRTLRQSKTLSDVFLRGCGLPDKWIDYLPSLVDGSPIQFYSCFISYSTANQDFANRLHADLQSKGVRCWFAPHHMQPGKKLHEQIDEAIRVYDRLLLILSPESMTSEWVATEIAKARKKEATLKRQVLFPISIVPYKEIESWELFDGDRGKDSAREIREYFIPDFSSWKNHDQYQKGFGRLLDALKNADVAPSARV